MGEYQYELQTVSITVVSIPLTGTPGLKTGLNS